MARYRKHIITREDTLQTISQRYTGDIQQWIRIAEYNNLRYPYLVDTTKEKEKQPEKVLTVGDTILIPIEQNMLDVDASSLGNRDRDLIMSLSLGMDLDVSGGDKRYQQHGTRDEVLELTGDGSGDIAIARGVDNIKQALIARLLTRKGALINHPNYGSELEDLIGEPANSMTKELVDNEILRTLKKDRRISEVRLVSSNINNEVYFGEFEIYLYSIDEMFTLVVENNEEGLVIR